MSTPRSYQACLSALAACLILAGCGAQDPSDDSPASGASTGITLACGDADLFAIEHDACGVMDVKATHDPRSGPCDCFLGYAWNGSECYSLGDCACTGADCDKLTDSLEACQALHAGCAEPKKTLSCGSHELFSLPHDHCAPMDASDWHEPEGGPCDCFLGWAWNGTACTMLGDCACRGEDCDKLVETQEACEAQHAACVEPKKTLSCGSHELFSLPHDHCAPMDASDWHEPEGGPCDCFLGWAWNGTECTMLGDCACRGDDCDKLTESEEQCEAAHAGCE